MDGSKAVVMRVGVRRGRVGGVVVAEEVVSHSLNLKGYKARASRN